MPGVMDTPQIQQLLVALRRGRLAAGLTQSALAEKVGCKQSALSMLEGGRFSAVSRETLARIADAVGVALPEDAVPPATLAAAALPLGFSFCPNGDCLSNLPYFVGAELLLLPLGTAGAVKNCADFTGNDDFLLISGDAACDFELSALWRRHRESGAAATIALHREADPLRFGLAVTDGAGWVRGFVEKPDWPGVVSDLVNTGIYVLSPRAMACVPEGKAFDFARDLFPLLLRRGERIAGLFPPEGQKKPRRTERAAAVRDFPCRDRAAAMGALSTLMLEMGAEYSDGIRFPLEEGSVHISPRADVSALSVAVDAPDAEFAAALTLSAGEIIKALNL